MDVYLFRHVFLSIILLLGPTVARADNPLPFADEINKIMTPLEYAGVPVLLRPKVKLSIDFKNRSWMLHDIHVYDAKGQVVLEQGRYGLCAELSAYMKDNVSHLFNEEFGIKYAMVTEKNYFFSQQSNHIVLIVADRKARETYLIDPSFHKYGRTKDLNEYEILSVEDNLKFIDKQLADDFFLVDQAMPLFIKDGVLVSFSVTSVNGTFDKDNFLLAISINSLYQSKGIDIMVVGKVQGKPQEYQTSFLVDQFFSLNDKQAILNKISVWLNQIGAGV